MSLPLHMVCHCLFVSSLYILRDNERRSYRPVRVRGIRVALMWAASKKTVAHRVESQRCVQFSSDLCVHLMVLLGARRRCHEPVSERRSERRSGVSQEKLRVPYHY